MEGFARAGSKPRDSIALEATTFSASPASDRPGPAAWTGSGRVQGSGNPVRIRLRSRSSCGSVRPSMPALKMRGSGVNSM
jgi:hypothetical protein